MVSGQVKTVANANKKRAARRAYQKRKEAGLCSYSGCPRKAKSGRTLCHTHLQRMSRDNKQRNRIRKKQGLCVSCGIRPPFWGRRCVICRQVSAKNADVLPRGARRALRLYREAARKFEIEQTHVEKRFSARRLLVTENLPLLQARALTLHLGLDRQIVRSYAEVGVMMRISRERVRQLLAPSNLILARSSRD